MAVVPGIAFLIGHFTGYTEDTRLDSEQLVEKASLSFFLAMVATLGVSLIVPATSMLADLVLGTGTTFMTGVTGTITAPVQALVESLVAGLIGFLATFVGYGARMLEMRLTE